jgi:acyl-CoA thioesterase II
MPEEAIGAGALTEQARSAFRVRRDGDLLVGESPPWFGPHVFGGILLAQALDAAWETVPDARRARSLHAYFLRPGDARAPLFYDVAAIRDGRSALTRAVTAKQDDKAVLTMLCSFAADTDGPAYELSRPDDIPDPSGVPDRPGPAPVEYVFVGPTRVREDGTRSSTHRAWMRIAADLPADARLHGCLLAFMGDMSWNGASPWDLSGPPDRSRMVSVDHAMWFHRPARADEWLFFDVHSLVHAGGRGTIRGVLYGSDRHVVCSMAQELQFR